MQTAMYCLHIHCYPDDSYGLTADRIAFDSSFTMRPLLGYCEYKIPAEACVSQGLTWHFYWKAEDEYDVRKACMKGMKG